MYNLIRKATGWVAVFIGFGYAIWAVIAGVAGHDRGVEIPLDVAIPAMTVIILLAFTSILMRLAERVEQRVVQTLVSDQFELLVSALDTKLQANNQQLQQMVKAEVAEAVEDVSTRTYRAALVKQASDMATEASVTRIPTRQGV